MVSLLLLALGQQALAQRTLYFDDLDLSPYPDNMSFTCCVEENGRRILDCEVAAFDQDGNLRGSYYSDPNGIVFLMVQGKANEGVIHFKVVTGYGTDEDPYVIRDINEIYHFFLNDILGEYLDPYVFTVGDVVSATPTAQLNEAGFATYSCGEDVKVKTPGVKAYRAEDKGEWIELTELNGYIPAGTGVLLYGEGVTEPIAFENPAAGDPVAEGLGSNCLQATTTATVPVIDKAGVTGTIWALGSGNAFQRYTRSAFLENRAFVVHEPTGNASEMRLVFADSEEQTTCIETLGAASFATRFDLSGRMSGQEGWQIRDRKIIITKKK